MTTADPVGRTTPGAPLQRRSPQRAPLPAIDATTIALAEAPTVVMVTGTSNCGVGVMVEGALVVNRNPTSASYLSDC